MVDGKVGSCGYIGWRLSVFVQYCKPWCAMLRAELAAKNSNPEPEYLSTS